MLFEAKRPPFQDWLGAFSPSRGRTSGFRIRGMQVGAWMQREDDLEFWSIKSSQGTQALVDLITKHWSGGRVLLLASGHVIKPLQQDNEVGKRVLVGKISGRILLIGPNGEHFNMADPEGVTPGSRWAGPSITGLECFMDSTGSITCEWTLPADDHNPTLRQRVRRQLRGADRKLAAGFRKSRPGESNGRVRLTVHGHLTTKKQIGTGEWETRYVGFVDPTTLLNLE